ncbi:TetR/AcrR family transcriptional regulator [Microbispora hainanensis]|jgi:AcrR family transcriptional regulator|uniref:TetR/AcrR family transcriptional regulator n=1 Tax=Microbispora hainanensis TaxID=568844 RepID=A0ABZ1T1B8_9ACTN|nr:MULTISPECIES: TetR/AcrR family transcriptional regulator [Microbispora]
MPKDQRVPEQDASGTPARTLRADAQRNRTRILEAAETVFAAKGPSASTEEIAQKAGVGIGTVFRHFPTKESLLKAIMHAVAVRLADEARALAAEGDPATAFFAFFTRTVEQAAEQKTVVDLLAQAGIPVTVAKPVLALREAVEVLVGKAQQAGAVRPDVRVPEIMALLVGVCQASLHTPWEPDLRARTLAIVFAGLRPADATG